MPLKNLFERWSMNHLFIVCHDECDDDDPDRDLNTYDQQSPIRRLVGRMKEFYTGSNIVVVSSPIPRAVKIAYIIVNSFGFSDIEKSDALNKGDDIYEEARATHKIVEPLENHDAVVLVGHKPTVSFINYLSARQWEKQMRLLEMQKGDVAYLDYREKKVHIRYG